MKKYKLGYTQGVFDMFHIGHLNLINRAKEYCEYLIVGVNSDQLVKEYKDKYPVVDELCREEIVSNIKAVDECVVVTTLDKKKSWEKFQYNAIFIGDDWKGNPRWEQTEKSLKPLGVDVIYLPYTPRISSTSLREVKDKSIE